MAHLSDETLFAESLPGEWRPALELLHAFDELVTAAQSAGKPTPEQLARAAELRAGLLRSAELLHEELPHSLRQDSAEYVQWFSEAVLLWPLFADAGGEVLVDTAGAATLAQYPLDLRAGDAEREHLRRALTRALGASQQQLEHSDALLEHLTANLRVKHAITEALRIQLQSGAGGTVTAGANVALMKQIYGELPWREGDVDVVLSSTALFLCVPYAARSLSVPGYAERPEAERAQISAFLERIHKEGQSLRSVRFPAFGLFDRTALDPALLARLTRGVQATLGVGAISERVVIDTLATMVTVVPRAEVDKYLVHDAWGHGWQESLCEFEWTFRDLPRLDEPLRLTGGIESVDGAVRESLADAFHASEGRTALRPETLVRVIEADLRHRIRVGLNLVISECLADLVEHKLVRHGSPLPSSSLLPLCPLKLDLSLTDAKRMLRAWRRPYRRLMRQAAEREKLRQQLLDLGLPEAGAAEALEQAVALIDERFGRAFEDSLEVGPADDPQQVRANLLQRIVLGVVAFERATTACLAKADELERAAAADPRWHRPIACIDLLVLLLGWFYEQERALHVWHLDELLTGALVPSLLQLEAALDQQ